MKKILSSILVLFILSTILIACAKSEAEDPEKKIDEILAQLPKDTQTSDEQKEIKPPATIEEEIDNYVNVELPKLWELEEVALLAFNSAVGENYVDDTTVYQALINLVIPQYKEFENQVKGLKTYSEELTKIQQIYIDAVTKQHEALEIMKGKLEEGDPNYIDAANEQISSATEGFSQWQTEVRALAAKYNIKIEEPDITSEDSSTEVDEDFTNGIGF